MPTIEEWGVTAAVAAALLLERDEDRDRFMAAWASEAVGSQFTMLRDSTELTIEVDGFPPLRIEAKTIGLSDAERVELVAEFERRERPAGP